MNQTVVSIPKLGNDIYYNYLNFGLYTLVISIDCPRFILRQLKTFSLNPLSRLYGIGGREKPCAVRRMVFLFI